MSKTRLSKIKAAIDYTIKATELHPSEISKSLLFKHLEDNPKLDKFTDWDLRVLGGLSNIIRAHYPVVSKELSVMREHKEVNKYISSLEKNLGDKKLFEEQLSQMVLKHIKPVEIGSYKIKTSKSDGLEREVVVSINDSHYGLKVAADEVNGSNQFSWVEASRRTAFLAQQVLDYKIEKRDQVRKLHVVLNGDILQGCIHDLTARTAELLVNQVNGAVHILAHFIATVAQGYPEVVVHCICGNHGNIPHRREGGRVTSHIYDSYENLVYYTLSAMFRESKNIKFHTTKGLHLDVMLPAGRLVVTHGDVLFSSALGNPSSNLQTKRLSDAINRYNTGEIIKGNAPIKMVLMGHVHSYVDFWTFDGVRVLVAPSLSGVDSYAASLGINCNTIGQVIFESTKEHILGDSRLVQLATADKDKSLDKIIPPFNNELQW